jgi:uncharacterized membrane protein
MITFERLDSATAGPATSLPAPVPAPRGERLRVELFSDAVFAVAITVLVLGLPLTTAPGSLLDALGSRWVSFAAFGISFAIIGCLWVSHWRILRVVEQCDEALALVNLMLLLFVVLIPFGASTMATFVTRQGAQSKLAAALFAAILLAMGLSFGLLASMVQRRATAPRLMAWPQRLTQMVGVLANLMAIGLAFVVPISVVAISGAIAVYYIAQEVAGCRHLAGLRPPRPAPWTSRA